RPGHPDDAAQPIAVRPRIRAEHVRKPGTAGKANGAVDEQELAMIAQKQTGKSSPARGIEKHQVDLRGSQAGPVRLAQSARAECIEHRSDADVALGLAGESVEEMVHEPVL